MSWRGLARTSLQLWSRSTGSSWHPHLCREPTGTPAGPALFRASGPDSASPTLFKNKLSLPPLPQVHKMIIHQTLIGEMIPAAALLPNVHLRHAGPSGRGRRPPGALASGIPAGREAERRPLSGRRSGCLTEASPRLGATWHCPSPGSQHSGAPRAGPGQGQGSGQVAAAAACLWRCWDLRAVCWAHLRCRWLGP